MNTRVIYELDLNYLLTNRLVTEKDPNSIRWTFAINVLGAALVEVYGKSAGFSDWHRQGCSQLQLWVETKAPEKLPSVFPRGCPCLKRMKPDNPSVQAVKQAKQRRR